MAKNTQPVLKRARTLGIEPGFMGIDKKSKRNPNQSRRKKSEYAGQLNEKQKVKFVYGLLEKQFRNKRSNVILEFPGSDTGGDEKWEIAF